MNRLEHFRFGNRKRVKLYIMLLTFLLLVALAFVILVLLGLFGFRAELVSVSLTDQRQNVMYNGMGINLDHIPNINLINNPSFEKESEYFSLTVQDSDGMSLFFTPDEVISSGINTARASGAPVRVVSIDAEGNMQLRYEGNIAGFDSAKLGQKSAISIPEALGGNSSIRKTCTLLNTVTALTDSGMVLADITSEQLTKLYDGGNVSFADICCNGSSIFAVTGDGIIYNSVDGKIFLEMNTISEDSQLVVKACAATSTVLTILNDKGELRVYDSGSYYKVSLPSDEEVGMLGAAGDFTFAVTVSGEVMKSSNGLIYDKVDTGDIYIDRVPCSLVCNADKAFILNDDGSITIIDPAEDTASLLQATSEGNATATSLVVTDKGQLIASTDDNTAVIISSVTGEAITISSENVTVNGVFPGPNGRILISSSDGLYSASVLSDFQLVNSAPADAISLGDICFIELSNSYVNAVVDTDDSWLNAQDGGVWDAYGDGTSIDISSDSYDGKNSMRLSGNSDNMHVISQKLAGGVKDNFAKDTFYKISLYAKSDNSRVAPDSVDVWLSGKSFGNQGLKISKIRNEYTEYSAVFIVNDRMMSDDTVRLNISFNGTGTLLIDQIYVGPDSPGKAEIPEKFTEGIKAGSPSAIRLNNLGIGSNGYSDSVFWGVSELSTGSVITDKDGAERRVSDVRSLEKSLKLVRDAGSNPWFVLGSFTTHEQVNNLVSYLCGSVSSTYGALRINNGTALPWSRQFDKVYFEIRDTEHSFTSDIQRSSYVDYVIGMITQSEFYTDIKDKIVYIDGMDYDGGMMLSSADAHASSMSISQTPSEDERKLTYMERVTAAFERVRNNAPRAAVGHDMGEFISSVDFDGEFSLAQYMSAVLGDSAYFSELTLINCGISFVPSSYGSDDVFAKGSEMRGALDMMSVVSPMRGTQRMYANVADPMSNKSGQSAEQFLKQCSVTQFDSEKDSYLVITNTSDSLCQFVMFNSSKSFETSDICRYSAEGKKINTRSMTNSYRRYNLQPGEMIIVTLYR